MSTKSSLKKTSESKTTKNFKGRIKVIDLLQQRPLSWSALSSFEYDKEQWYKRYILNEKSDENAEMKFGKLVADSFGTDNPLAPVTLYPTVEHKLSVVFSGIPLIGFMDTYDHVTKKRFGEFKTGKKAWDQKRANEHGQLHMYSLMHFITEKIKPEDLAIFLEWIPTQSHGDFSISFIEPVKVHHFDVKLTMNDILRFGSRIKTTVEGMQEYVDNRLT